MINPKPDEKAKINLKVLREKRGWTKTRAAAELGFSIAYYSGVERGQRAISIKMMHAIIKVFNVEYEDFYK